MNREDLGQAFLLLIIWSFFAGVGIVLGRKKGVSVPFAILGSFPLWVALFAFWLVRQPDVDPDDRSNRT